jgi:hypothetical protein
MPGGALSSASRFLASVRACVSSCVRHESTMKAFLGGFITAVILAFAYTLWRGVRDAEWMIMSIKYPGTVALRDIQADLTAKRYDLAKQKTDILLQSWEAFSAGPDACTGTGISGIAKTFLEMPGGMKATNAEPGGAANRSQPVRSNTNSTSAAAVSGR